MNKVKDEILSITNFSRTAALTTVENKISNASDLVKKRDCNTKYNEIEKKIINDDHSNTYITTPEFNKF